MNPTFEEFWRGTRVLKSPDELYQASVCTAPDGNKYIHTKNFRTGVVIERKFFAAESVARKWFEQF